MRMYPNNVLKRPELSATIMVAAILMAAGLSKLGHGWWAIGVMAALCLLGVVVEHLAGRPAGPGLARAGIALTSKPGSGSV